MKKEKKEESFIKNPFYKGGGKAMNDLIYSNLKYPREAAEAKIEGVVIIKYDIDHQGHVIDARVVKSLGYGCDEEAVRVVKMLKFEVPKTPRKLKVVFHKDIQIYFKVAKPIANTIPQQSPAQGYQIVYNLQAAKPENTATQEETTPPKTFTYTIKI